MMFLIRNDYKEFVINSFNFRISKQIFHWKCRKISSTITRSASSCQFKDGSMVETESLKKLR